MWAWYDSSLSSRHSFLPRYGIDVFSLLVQIAGGFGIRFSEWQAVVTARVLAGRAQLPDRNTMKQWEQARLAERGEGAPYWTLAPEFEFYFEGLRALAGEPAPGTTGRVLPKYESAWGDELQKLIKRRHEWWMREADKASRNMSSL